MFTKVHHVSYVVWNVAQMADYMEKNFGMKPEKAYEATNLGFKSVMYRVGDTIMDFFEPTRDDSEVAGLLKERGPGVYHVAWGVEGVDGVFEDLKGKGNEMRGDGPRVSPLGYKNISIEPSSSHGIYFQIADVEAS